MLLIYLYIILTYILEPFAPFYLSRRLRKGKEDRVRYKEKLGVVNEARPQGKMIWLHAASVGESNIAINLIRALHEKHPQDHFLLTTVTLSSYKLIERADLPNTIHQYAPLDIPGIVKKFLKHWSPDLSVFIESEIWPNMVMQTRKICSILLVNARLSDRSFKRWKILKEPISKILRLYHSIQPGTKIDVEKFNFFYDKVKIFSY